MMVILSSDFNKVNVKKEGLGGILTQLTFSLGKRKPVVYDFSSKRCEDAFGMKLYSAKIKAAMTKSHNRAIVSAGCDF